MIELVLLGLLYDGIPYTGYDLRKMMMGSIEFFQNNSLGSIQPGLKRLNSLGQVISETQVINGRKKVFYEITDDGKRRFKEELLRDPSADKIRCNQLVKVFFFGKFSRVEQQESVKMYIAEIKSVRDTLLAVEAHLSAILNKATEGEDQNCRSTQGNEDFSYQLDTLRFGLDYYQFIEGWFNHYLSVLEQREREKSQ